MPKVGIEERCVIAPRRPKARTKSAGFVVPLLGIGASLACYCIAASLYPGGNQAHPRAAAYSHLHNYWCDLLDAVSYSGEHNPGRPLGVAATVILPTSLVPFFWQVTRLFPASRRLTMAVRATGIPSLLLATLVFTSWHDGVIQTASALGLVALAAIAKGLWRARQRLCLGLETLAAGLCLLNYVMWEWRLALVAMPTVQRFAFVSVWVWVLVTGARIGGQAPRRVAPAPEPSSAAEDHRSEHSHDPD